MGYEVFDLIKIQEQKKINNEGLKQQKYRLHLSVDVGTLTLPNVTSVKVTDGQMSDFLTCQKVKEMLLSLGFEDPFIDSWSHKLQVFTQIQ